MKPSPSQARLLAVLRDHPGKLLRVWFTDVRISDGMEWNSHKEPIKSTRATVMSCLRLGWIDRLSVSKNDYGSRESFYRVSPDGLHAIVGLNPEDFVTPPSVPVPSVAGEAARVIRALAGRHEWHKGWVFIPEAPGGVDALAVNCYHGRAQKTVGYEVKVTRGDFKTELRMPEKTARSATCCTHFFFACPSGLIKTEEVPDPYGLIYVNEKGRTRMVKRSSMPPTFPTWLFLGLLVRRITAMQDTTEEK